MGLGGCGDNGVVDVKYVYQTIRTKTLTNNQKLTSCHLIAHVRAVLTSRSLDVVLSYVIRKLFTQQNGRGKKTAKFGWKA